MMRRLLVCCLAVVSVWPAVAQADAPKPIVLTLHPKAPATPVLTWHLLPEVAERTPGNAAPFYKKAIELLEKGEERTKIEEQLSAWRETPLADFPRAEVRKFLDKRQELFNQIDAGARCEYWDYGLLERMRESGIGALMPEIQEARTMANYLAVRARCELAEGQPEQALRTLRTGLGLARHAGDSPTLIANLVENAVASIMLGQLDEVVGHSNTPNLYWALTDLPRPFADLRKPLEGERLWSYATFPGMLESATDLNAGPIKEEQAQAIVKVTFGLADSKPGFLERAAFGLRISSRHEKAKEALIAQGRPKDKVEAMPHVQVALLYAFRQYDEFLDDLIKWRNFPYWEARLHLQEVNRRLARAKAADDGPAIPLVALLIPAVDKVFTAQARLERKIAALRCVEALRLYAAAHGGKLPATLGEIIEVPIPVDPLTGKAFRYEAKDGKATLTTPPFPAENPRPDYVLAYEITLMR
jgi:hypothetical protein